MTHHEGEQESSRRFADLVAALVDAAVASPGRLPAHERRAAFAGEQLDGVLGAFADKVRNRAYTVSDEDINALRRHGLNEQAIFELTIACAIGAAHSQLQAGLTALGYES